MACLYQRKDSKFLWIKFRNKGGETEHISTKCRANVPTELRRARQMAAEKNLEEFQSAPHGATSSWKWVTEFFSIRYKSKPATLERYTCAWPTIELFLKEKEISVPSQLTRAHCFEYMTWRSQPDKSIRKYKACHNTALLELKILRIVMNEAVVRGMAPGNPCVKLEINREERKLKPELTDADVELIRSKIPEVADPMVREMLTNSFEIARYQGCRLSETRLNPFTDVDINEQTIAFHAKGGKRFMTALHPKLIPLFTRLRTENRKETWSVPEKSGRQWASAKWFKFLDSHGLKKAIGSGACFHSTRVTVVTRMARRNVSISKAKSYVGHASEIIHSTYQRLISDDLDDCTQAVD